MKVSADEIIQIASEEYGVKTAIAKRCGISRVTLDKYAREDPKIAAAIKNGRKCLDDLCRSAVVDLIKQKNVSMVIFYCKTRLRWSENRVAVDDREDSDPFDFF